MKREYLYAGGAVLALVLGYVVYRKFGNALATTFNPASDQNAAYKGVNALGHLLGMDENDSVGTGLYGLLHTESNPNAAPGSMASQERSVFDATTWGSFGRWWYTLWYGEEAAAGYYGDKPASSYGSYDYGTSGASGIPWRYEAKPLIDPFNANLGYLFQ